MNADRSRFTLIKKKKKSVKIICGNLRCEASAGICVPIFVRIGALPRVTSVPKMALCSSAKET